MCGPSQLLFFQCGPGMPPGWALLVRTSEGCVCKNSRETGARNLQGTRNPPRLCCDPTSVLKAAPILFIRAERPSNRCGVTEAPTEGTAVHRLWSSDLSTHRRLRASPPLCSLCPFSVSSRVWLRPPPCSTRAPAALLRSTVQGVEEDGAPLRGREQGRWGPWALTSPTDVPWWGPPPPSRRGDPTCPWAAGPRFHVMRR